MTDNPAASDRSINILLVDNEPPVLAAMSLSLSLQRDSWNILTATSGPHALRVATEHAGNIQVLVSEIRIGIKNGFELANKLCEEIPNLCVLLMSGCLGDLDLSKAPGHASFLQKPFPVNELIDVIERLLQSMTD